MSPADTKVQANEEESGDGEIEEAFPETDVSTRSPNDELSVPTHSRTVANQPVGATGEAARLTKSQRRNRNKRIRRKEERGW